MEEKEGTQTKGGEEKGGILGGNPGTRTIVRELLPFAPCIIKGWDLNPKIPLHPFPPNPN